jgi:hypothetical protein
MVEVWVFTSWWKMYEVENADGGVSSFEKEFSKLLSFLLILRDMVCMKTPILH